MNKAIPRSKSCESLDLISKVSETDSVTKGRLKEHRRKGRRAVTLNNLDSKQLLLILDLQRRYHEETRLLKSQGNLNLIEPGSTPPITDIAIQRRAITPQPCRKVNPNTLPRSHTPQPGHVGGDIRMGELVRDLQNCIKEKRSKKKSEDNAKITQESVGHQAPPGQNEGYVHMAPRPKSRPSVQRYFLPPHPIQRCRSTSPFAAPRQRKTSASEQLPAHPISRPPDPFTLLPPAPIQRDGSAFQLVGHPLGPMYNKGSVSHDVIFRTPGELFCENAIRDNFKLYASPFILQNTKQRRVDSVPNAYIPPPYSNPPSYTDFLSRTDSGQESGSEHIYETYENIVETRSPSRTFSQKQNPQKKSGSLQTTESEDDVFLPVKAATGGTHSSPTQPHIPGYNDSSRRRKPKKRSGRQKHAPNEKDPCLHHSHVSPSIDSSQNSQDSDNVYAVSAKVKPKCGQAIEAKVSVVSEIQNKRSQKLETNDPPSSCSPLSSAKVDAVIEGEESSDVTKDMAGGNGSNKSEGAYPVNVLCSRGYSERPSESSGCTYEDVEESSIGVSSQTSLISSSDEITREFNRAIDEIHPGLGDPRVQETMI